MEREGAITGALLFVGGTGAVVWAERYIPSGVAALVVATEPLSFVLLEAMRRRRRPHGVVLAGLALGSAGLLVLVGPGTFFGGERFHLAACLVVVAGAFAWAWGSLYSRGSRLPGSPIMATAATLLSGGALLALLGVFMGELGAFDPSAVSTRSIVATVYLFVFGSIVGFSAYLWLLRVSTASRVSTYAYVNPIIAVFLGWALAGETLTGRVLVAAVIIVGAVALIIRHGGEEAKSRWTACRGGAGDRACLTPEPSSGRSRGRSSSWRSPRCTFSGARRTWRSVSASRRSRRF